MMQYCAYATSVKNKLHNIFEDPTAPILTDQNNLLNKLLKISVYREMRS